MILGYKFQLSAAMLVLVAGVLVGTAYWSLRPDQWGEIHSPAYQLFATDYIPTRPLPRHASAVCPRVSINEFLQHPQLRQKPVVVVDGGKLLTSHSWADPILSPLVVAGEHQRVVAHFAPDPLMKAAGVMENESGFVLQHPLCVVTTLARFVHLATRQQGDDDSGCCLKVTHIPFVDADDFLPISLLSFIESGRAKAKLTLRADELAQLIPKLWAYQSRTVTALHFDEIDSFVAQAAGTRIVTLYPPEADLKPAESTRFALFFDADRERLVDIHRNSPSPPDRVKFPKQYALRFCDSSGPGELSTQPNCTRPTIDGRSLPSDQLLDSFEHFSPLDLAAKNAPLPAYTCPLGPGDLLFTPRKWWHRMDDDPVDNDTMQVSLSWWCDAT